LKLNKETKLKYSAALMYRFGLIKLKQKNMITHKLFFFTEYYQFYILDAESPAITDAPDFWNEAADKRKLAIGQGILGVTVAKYAEIKVEVDVLDAKPKIDTHADHIVEASLNIASGTLQIKDCTAFDTILELKLDKALHKIRISSYNLGSVKNDEGDDYYKVEIWPNDALETIILKEWNP
jgi:hypothetical protein